MTISAAYDFSKIFWMVQQATDFLHEYHSHCTYVKRKPSEVLLNSGPKLSTAFIPETAEIHEMAAAYIGKSAQRN
jgi:hypothetical protein